MLKEEPDSIKEYETLIKDCVDAWLKEDNFNEMCTFWRNISDPAELDESRTRGLKSKTNEKINDSISLDCNKYNLLLRSTLLSYVWGSLSYLTRSTPQSIVEHLPLLSSFKVSKSEIPWLILNKMLKLHLQTLGTDSDNESIHINRKKALDFANSGLQDLKGEHTIFAQAQKTLEARRYRGMRINSADRKAWFVKFIGECAVDDGGLFRESLSEMCGELKNGVLPLLLKSKNQQAETGLDREMYVLNPGASTEPQTKMMEFLGALMGLSIRSGILLDLNISRFAWKQITGDQVTLEDLSFVDKLYVTDLENVLAKSKSLSDEEFEKEFADRTMSTMLSNDQLVDLVDNGQQAPLTKASAQLFYDKSLEVRFAESRAQVEALVAGIHKTFDMKFLRIMNWKYLEYKVVGINEISVQRLKEITAYRNCSETHEVVKRFWAVLESLPNEDKISYLRFVWGRTRLPLKEEEVVESHYIQLDEHAESNRLPIGRTCFFRLELPPYESTAQMKLKLLYAINHCKQIDADYDRTGVVVEDDPTDNVADPGNGAGESDSDENPRRRRHDAGPFAQGDDEDSYGGGGEEEEE